MYCPRMRFAQIFFFRLRKLAAWALLRPSARASAKLANRTVNHNHNVTPSVKPLNWKIVSNVVKILPT